MFENRFFSWGISTRILFFIGIFPLLFVLVFHPISPEWVVMGILFAVFWVFILSRGFYRFSKYFFSSVLLGLTLELIIALRDKNYIQMTMGIICVIAFMSLFYWLEGQMKRAQHNPGIRWYEGLPQFFPKVKIEVFWNGKWFRASLRKIDDHGMFVFLQQSEYESEVFRINGKVRKSVLPLKVQYRDYSFEGEAKLQSVFYERWLGMGLQICPKDLYHYTQYSKIVQNLKGEGYAI